MSAARRLMLLRSGAFDPRSPSGLVLWFDASDLATVWQDAARSTPAAANGDPVGGVTEKSATGAHAIQGTASAKPSVIQAARNGRSVLRFDGVDDQLVFEPNPIQASTAFTVLVVSAGTGGGGVQVVVNFGFGYPQLKDSSDAWALRAAAAWHEINADSSGLSAWRVRGLVVGSGGSQAYRQLDTAQGSLAIAPDGAGGSGSTLGYGAQGFAGDLGEVLVYNRALSLTEYRMVSRYLTAKWGAA